MIPLFKRSALVQGRLRALPFALPACAALALAAGSLHASPVPPNLGNGLDRLVKSQIDMQTKPAYLNGRAATYAAEDGRSYTTEQNAAMANLAIKDDTGRMLVRIYGDGTMPINKVRKNLKAALTTASFTAVDRTYRSGVMNAYVALEEVSTMATQPGVRLVVLELKPYHSKVTREKALAVAEPGVVAGQVLNKLGTAFDQGVILHRIDTINQGYNPAAPVDYEGQGMKIACISNSYGSNPTNTASIDVANGDLPGATNPYNTTDVYVLQDDVGNGTNDDEGRGMCQIVYKMAPKAAIAFATADSGEVGFANNIRLLGGLTVNGVTGTFGADSICDDVGYFDEPFFQDGIIGGGVDDVAAAGVVYSSSAANDIGTNGYDSDSRWIANGSGLTAAAGNTALTGTNIDLTNVPAGLYAGGFHNFNPGGQDVAQTVNIAANNTVDTIFQWNDPYDQNTSPNYTATLFQTTGTYTATDLTYTVPATVTQGTLYEVAETAINGSTFDGIVTVYKSDGTTVIAGPQDTGTDETVRFFAPANDTGFVVKIGHYSTTMGDFSLLVRSASGFPVANISSTLSLLVFTTAGVYIPASSLTTDARSTNQPIQIGFTNRPSGTQVQYVIARATVPANPAYPTHLRYQIPGNGRAGYGPAEYFTYNTVTTSGHAMANGCNGAAAYDSFRPNLPATFTSPGPVTIYYDKQNNRLNPPEIRLQPRVAADNNANISTNMSYFVSDVGQDPDTNPNFSGTSAASPHTAAIAALVLQSHGGRRSLTPAQVTSILERSAYPHDLDPNSASGTARVTGGTTGAGKVTITINSDASTASAAGTTGTGGNDTHSFAIGYVGGSSVTSIVFNPGGTAATGGNVTGGNNGVTYNATGVNNGGTATYFENSLPGVAFLPSTKAFTQPTAATPPVGVSATAAYTFLSSGTNQYYTMTLTPTSTFSGGSTLYFTVGRGVARSATTGSATIAVTSATTGSALYTADIFGGGVFLPSGQVVSAGMTFSGTTADGGTFNGTIRNLIGSGWATQDGFGMINAQTAVGLAP